TVALRHLSLAAGWYDIEVDDAITFVSRSATVLRCFDVEPAEFDPECDGRLARDPRAGPLLEVNRSPVNEERLETSGLDLELAYFRELGPGPLDMSVLHSFLRECLITAVATRNGDRKDGEIEVPTNPVHDNLRHSLARV